MLAVAIFTTPEVWSITDLVLLFLPRSSRQDLSAVQSPLTRPAPGRRTPHEHGRGMDDTQTACPTCPPRSRQVARSPPWQLFPSPGSRRKSAVARHCTCFVCLLPPDGVSRREWFLPDHCCKTISPLL